MKVPILQTLSIRVLETIEASIPLQRAKNLASKGFLEHGFQHRQIDLSMGHLLEDVVIAKLRTLILLASRLFFWLLRSFWTLKTLTLESS